MASRSGVPVDRRFEPVQDNSDRREVYPIREAGVDWITVTCRQGESQDSFDQFGYSLLHTESEAGSKLKPWRFEGFEGLNAGHIAFGKSEEMSIMRLSSGVAWAYWHRAHELSTNCSRIDFQVTFHDVTNASEVILNAHQSALAHQSEKKRPCEVDLRLSNRRGPTLYLGVRTSDRFGRLYDKFRESKLKHYAGCVRAELQVNGKAANFAARALSQRSSKPTEVIGYVSGFFSRRGVSPPWPYKDEHRLIVPRSRSSAHRRLAWIRSQVAPAVQQLIAAGYARAALEALLLSDVDCDTLKSIGPSLKEME